MGNTMSMAGGKKGTKRKRDLVPKMGAFSTNGVDDDATTSVKFLSDDLILEIFSYIAFGPCEKPSADTEGTLTHTLPLVCKQFWCVCETSDELWLSALQRLIQNNPKQWEAGLLWILRAGSTNPPWSCYYRPELDQNNFVLAAQVKELAHMTDKQVRSFLRELCESSSLELESSPVPSTGDTSDRSSQPKYCPDSHISHHALLVKNGQLRSKVKRVYISLLRNHATISLPIVQDCHNNVHASRTLKAPASRAASILLTQASSGITGGAHPRAFKLGKSTTIRLPHCPALLDTLTAFHFRNANILSSNNRNQQKFLISGLPLSKLSPGNSSAMMVLVLRFSRVRADGSVEILVLPIREVLLLKIHTTSPGGINNHNGHLVGKALVKRFF